MARTGPRRAPAFTLVELLVVIVIVLLVSAVTLPAIVPALSHRQVSEAARLLQGQLVQARDTAIRYNQARGVRFLPDPTYANATTILAYNRMLPLEPGPDYSNGLVTVWPVPNPGNAMNPPTNPPTPSAYPVHTVNMTSPVYPYYPQTFVGATMNPGFGQCLMLEQAPFAANDPAQTINAPTSWFWNVRIGDRIKIANAGQTYTVVGPCTVNPITGGGNPELFVNVGQPGDTSGYLSRTYTNGSGASVSVPVEFLYLVNGVDDGGMGYVDSGWNGIVDWGLGYGTAPMPTVAGDMIADNLFDWQTEKWVGVVSKFGSNDSTNMVYNAAAANTAQANGATIMAPTTYTVYRRPVPAQSARETMLPSGVVIDCTTWNTTNERSHLPVDPFTKYIDIMVQPTGQVQPTTLYSTPASFSLGDSFYQFWLSERADVHESTDLWGPGNSPPGTAKLTLPSTLDAYNTYVSGGGSLGGKQPGDLAALKGERMLVTLFSRTGQITNSSLEFASMTDPNYPFYDSQLGQREAK